MINQEKREVWLNELSEFIVEANRETWAADKGEIEPVRPGDKTHEYKRGPWWLVDTYSGYFQAPGLTVVRYNEIPAWHMYYGGSGMETRSYDRTKETFQFLRHALMNVSEALPLRGPKEYNEGDWHYAFIINRARSIGDLTDCRWTEVVRNKGALFFRQEGSTGLYIHRSEDRQPIYPWDIK